MSEEPTCTKLSEGQICGEPARWHVHAASIVLISSSLKPPARRLMHFRPTGLADALASDERITKERRKVVFGYEERSVVNCYLLLDGSLRPLAPYKAAAGELLMVRVIAVERVGVPLPREAFHPGVLAPDAEFAEEAPFKCGTFPNGIHEDAVKWGAL